jgi:hypothetical protein
MTARTSKRRTAKLHAPKATAHTNGTMPVQQEANGSALAKTEPKNGQRKPPVPYSEAVADVIIDRLREGESLLSICQSDDLPSESAVRQWAADPAHPFAPHYARAREVGYLKMADEVIALSDGLEAGANRFDPGVVQRHRLMVDSRKWILSKALPKIYGDRIDARLADANGEPLQIQTVVAVRALIEAMPELGALPALASAVPAGVVEVPAASSEPEGGQS